MTATIDKENKVLTVLVPGDIVSTNAAGLKNELFPLLEAPESPEEPWDRLEVNLASARMVDSVGLNLLVSLVKILNSHGKKLRILTKSAHIRRALKFTRVDQMAEVE